MVCRTLSQLALSVIKAHLDSNTSGDPARCAEGILDRWCEYRENDNKNIPKPSFKSIDMIVRFHRFSTAADAPYRAEYMLQRMVELYRAGQLSGKPKLMTVVLVMQTYTVRNHPDAGTSLVNLYACC